MTDRPIIFSAPMVRALLDGRKTQTRRIISPRNTRFDGGAWPRNRFEQCKWDAAWLDAGPSPAGNPGPYLKVEYPHQDDETLVSRVYPLVQPSDRLYVREAWAPIMALTHNDPGGQAIVDGGFYRADGGTTDGEIARWRPSIHMPRWASRLTLAVTDVRAQRLQDIGEADAIAEGIEPLFTKADIARRPELYSKPMPWLNYLWHGHHDLTKKQIDEWPHQYSAYSEARLSFSSLWAKIHGPDAWDANPWVVAVSFDVHHGNIDKVKT